MGISRGPPLPCEDHTGRPRECAGIEDYADHELILLDTGSAEHVCPEEWHAECGTDALPPNQGQLRDIQGHSIVEGGKRTVRYEVLTEGDEDNMPAGGRFSVAPVRETVLGAVKLVEEGNAVIHLEKGNSYMLRGQVKAPLVLRGGRSFLPVRVVSAGERGDPQVGAATAAAPA